MTDTIERERTVDLDEPIGWAVVELLGHRRLAGYVSTESLADAAFLRVAVPTPKGGAIVQWVSPTSVYAITPATEETVRRAIASSSFRPEPVTLFEIGRPAVEADEVADWLDDEQRLAQALRALRQRDWIPADDDENARKLLDLIRHFDSPF